MHAGLLPQLPEQLKETSWLKCATVSFLSFLPRFQQHDIKKKNLIISTCVTLTSLVNSIALSISPTRRALIMETCLYLCVISQ